MRVLPKELFKETIDDLKVNRLRSFLTMLGIAWGVASLILLTAVGEGIRRAQFEKRKELGKNIMIIWGGSTSIAGKGIRPGKPIYLTYSDYKALKENCRLIKKISPEIERGDLISVTSSGKGNFDVTGILPEYERIRTIELDRGRLLNELDITYSQRVCIIGYEVERQLFDSHARLGAMININGMPYILVGVLRRKDQNSSYSGPDNRKIFVPYTAMRRDFPPIYSPLGDRAISDIIAQPVSVDLAEAAEKQVRRILARRKLFDPLDKDALPIWNTVKGAKMLNKIFSSMKLFLGFVAVLTLILGGIGVMNIMLVAARSRTREIGIRKAIGATRGDILALFFLETLLISLISGLIGFVVAVGICSILNMLPLPDFFAGFIISPFVGLSAFGFLVAVSIISAFYPSYQAAQLDPVVALRWEE